MVALRAPRRGLIDKAMHGDVGAFDLNDGLEVARTATGFMRRGTLIDPALAAVQGVYEGDQEYKDLAKRFGDLQRLSRESSVLRRKVTEVKNRWQTNLVEAGVASIGGVAGAIALSSLFPVAGLAGLAVGAAGCIGGGMVADQIYCKVKPPAPQDALAIADTFDKLRAENHRITAGMMAVLALASLDGAAGKEAEDMLDAQFGSRDFYTVMGQLLESGNVSELAKLRPLIGRFDQQISAAIRLPIHPNQPDMTVAKQMAELVNAGVVSATDLVVRPGKTFRTVANFYRQQTQEPATPPVMPAVVQRGLPSKAMTRGFDDSMIRA